MALLTAVGEPSLCTHDSHQGSQARESTLMGHREADPKNLDEKTGLAEGQPKTEVDHSLSFL